MAITKVAFTNATSRTTMGTELYNFLNTYAADYFDSITQGTSSITCTIDGVNVLTIALTSNTQDVVTLVNGSTFSFPSAASEVGYYVAGYATSKGVALLKNSAYQAYNTMLFIFKDADGNTGFSTIYVNHSGTSTSQPVVARHGIFTGSAVLAKSVTLSPYSVAAYCTNKAYTTGVTSFSPVCCDSVSESIADGFFLVPFSQYAGVPGIITVNGKQYVYDGLHALEE